MKNSIETIETQISKSHNYNIMLNKNVIKQKINQMP